MYINPIVVGVACTLLAEVLVALIAYWWENKS